MKVVRKARENKIRNYRKAKQLSSPRRLSETQRFDRVDDKEQIEEMINGFKIPIKVGLQSNKINIIKFLRPGFGFANAATVAASSRLPSEVCNNHR